MFTIFVSDLHLDSRYPESIHRFVNLLETQAQLADALYILGDLFEIWIGDDYIDPAYRPVITSLNACTGKGLPIFLLHGNRDFLLGEAFMQQTGCTLLPDPVLIELYEKPALLMHGDLLCTDDAEYQVFRRTVRDPEWQTDVLKKPVAERLAMASDARTLSSELSRDKPDAIMDVNQNAVRQVFKEYNVRLLIHGHTHRPGFHELTGNQEKLQRIVLGDWHGQGNFLKVTADKMTLEYC